MARKINPVAVYSIISAMNEKNANPAVGLTVGEVLAAVGDVASERTVRRMLNNPSLGFFKSEHTVQGAATYYHDLARMTFIDSTKTEDGNVVSIDTLLEANKIELIVQNLTTILSLVDPGHAIVKMQAEEEAKLKADKKKDFFDWYLGTTIVRRITEQTNAKETIKGFSEYSIEQFRENMRKHLEKPDVDWVLFFMFSLEMLRRQAIKDNGGKLPD